MDVIQQDEQFITHTYARKPLVIDHAQGAIAYDENGKRYIDFTSGIGVNALGYGNEAWVQAIAAQAKKLSHCSNHYYQKATTTCAKLLCQKSGASNVFFSNSGAESNECAIKAARKYSYDTYGSDRYEILTLQRSFHGRTITTLSATGQEVFHQYYHPFTEGFTHMEPNDLTDFYQKVNKHTCAILMELVQGEGGVYSLQKDYVSQIAQYCKQHDLLIIIDEVQSGVGRCGSFCAYEQYDIQPDIVTLAKGLGAGLPIAATLFYQKTKDVFQIGDHGSTFGGNPIVCAGTNLLLQHMNEGCYQHVQEMGDLIVQALQTFPHITEVNGMGLMIGATVNDVSISQVIDQCLQKGLLVLTAKQRLRLLPPLTITKAEITEGLRILKDVLSNQ